MINKGKKLVRKFQSEILPGLVAGIVIRNGSVYGYEIMKTLRKDHGGTSLGPSSVYPLLTEMERENYLSSSMEVVNGRARKMYTPTEKTRSIVDAYKNALELSIEAMAKAVPKGVKIRNILPNPVRAWKRRMNF
jgi:DNA-binding PadR family transcriptional regulator